MMCSRSNIRNRRIFIRFLVELKKKKHFRNSFIVMRYKSWGRKRKNFYKHYSSVLFLAVKIFNKMYFIAAGLNEIKNNPSNSRVS